MILLNDENFLEFAAKAYTNNGCTSFEDFLEDLNRVKYLKKLFYTYKKKNLLRDRLILNHIIVLYNTFKPKECEALLLFKLSEYRVEVAEFLRFLNRLSDKVDLIEGEVIFTSNIERDFIIEKALKCQQ